MRFVIPIAMIATISGGTTMVAFPRPTHSPCEVDHARFPEHFFGFARAGLDMMLHKKPYSLDIALSSTWRQDPISRYIRCAYERLYLPRPVYDRMAHFLHSSSSRLNETEFSILFSDLDFPLDRISLWYFEHVVPLGSSVPTLLDIFFEFHDEFVRPNTVSRYVAWTMGEKERLSDIRSYPFPRFMPRVISMGTGFSHESIPLAPIPTDISMECIEFLLGRILRDGGRFFAEASDQYCPDDATPIQPFLNRFSIPESELSEWSVSAKQWIISLGNYVSDGQVVAFEYEGRMYPSSLGLEHMVAGILEEINYNR
jgi:hypothetical protein